MGWRGDARAIGATCDRVSDNVRDRKWNGREGRREMFKWNRSSPNKDVG